MEITLINASSPEELEIKLQQFARDHENDEIKDIRLAISESVPTSICMAVIQWEDSNKNFNKITARLFKRLDNLLDLHINLGSYYKQEFAPRNKDFISSAKNKVQCCQICLDDELYKVTSLIQEASEVRINIYKLSKAPSCSSYNECVKLRKCFLDKLNK